MRQNTPPYSGQPTQSAVQQQQQQYFNGGQFTHQTGQYPGGQYAAGPGGFQQDVSSGMRSMNYQHSPIPGNPTPPLTPAGSMPPYISPNADTKPGFNDLKPPLPIQSEYD